MSHAVEHIEAVLFRKLPGTINSVIRQHIHFFPTDTSPHLGSAPIDLITPLTNAVRETFNEAASSFKLQTASNTPPLADSSAFECTLPGSHFPGLLPQSGPETTLIMGNIDLTGALGVHETVRPNISASDALDIPSLNPNSEVLGYEPHSFAPLSLIHSSSIDLELPNMTQPYDACPDRLTPLNTTTAAWSPSFSETLAETNTQGTGFWPELLDVGAENPQNLPCPSSVVQEERIRIQAATKGMEFLDDSILDPGNLVTGLSSSLPEAYVGDADSIYTLEID